MNQPFATRATLALLALLALAGLALGWNKGQLPRREQPAIPAGSAAHTTAPDLALYREMIAAVRGGANYYDAAREALPRYGFPIASPLNWRLPTYAWLFSRLPNKCWIQAVLLVLAVGGLWLAFVAGSRRSSVGQAGLTTFLLFGVIRWTFDGEAYLAQEVWAAVLILISISAHALANQRMPDAHHPSPSAPPQLRVRLPSASAFYASPPDLPPCFFVSLRCPTAASPACWPAGIAAGLNPPLGPPASRCSLASSSGTSGRSARNWPAPKSPRLPASRSGSASAGSISSC